MATTTDNHDQSETENVSSGKRLVADWVLGLGEPATQLEVLQSSTEDPESSKIVVLGIRNIFILHHTGVLIFCKKLDFPPVAMLSYPSGKLLSFFSITLIMFYKERLKILNSRYLLRFN